MKKTREKDSGGAFRPLLNLKSSLGKIEKREEKLERLYERKVRKLENKGRDTGDVEEDYQREKEDLEKTKRETKSKAYSKVLDRLNVGGMFYTSKPVLKKAKPLTKPLNAEKAILQGTGKLALVKEVENNYSNPVQDNRSLYFKDSFIKERSENRKWLS